MYDDMDEKRAENETEIIDILKSAIERKERDVNRFKEMISETDSEELKSRYDNVITFVKYEIATCGSALLYLVEGRCVLPECEEVSELGPDLENILKDYYSALDGEDLFFYGEVTEVLDVYHKEVVVGMCLHLGKRILTDKKLRKIALSDEDLLIDIGSIAIESGLFEDMI